MKKKWENEPNKNIIRSHKYWIIMENTPKIHATFPLILLNKEISIKYV